jgi:hypothetical protein
VSPSWVERWRVGLAPEGAELLRLTWWGKPAAGAPLRVPCLPSAPFVRAEREPGEPREPPAPREPRERPAWEPALDAMDQAFAAADATGAAVGVVLSNHFVRYLTLPWQPALNSARELLELAQLRMQQVYGDAAARWTVRCSEGGWGQPSVACAVDAELVASLTARLAARRLRLASLQPLLMAACHDLRRQLRGDATLALAEPGRLCLGLWREGGLHTVVSRRTGADAAGAAAQELAALGVAPAEAELALLRVGAAAAWPEGAPVAARELAAAPRSLAACGVA